jgi:hypothetical protein
MSTSPGICLVYNRNEGQEGTTTKGSLHPFHSCAFSVSNAGDSVASAGLFYFNNGTSICIYNSDKQLLYGNEKQCRTDHLEPIKKATDLCVEGQFAVLLEDSRTIMCKAKIQDPESTMSALPMPPAPQTSSPQTPSPALQTELPIGLGAGGSRAVVGYRVGAEREAMGSSSSVPQSSPPQSTVQQVTQRSENIPNSLRSQQGNSSLIISSLPQRLISTPGAMPPFGVDMKDTVSQLRALQDVTSTIMSSL